MTKLTIASQSVFLRETGQAGGWKKQKEREGYACLEKQEEKRKLLCRKAGIHSFVKKMVHQ